MDFVLFLHIGTAIFLIGPLTAAVMGSVPQASAGADGVSTLRWMHRTTKIYSFASILVFLFGMWLVAGQDYLSFNAFWLSASMTLFIVALALLFALVIRDQGTAIKQIEAGESASVQRGRIAGVGGAVSLIWIAILLLMIYKPGA